MQEADRTVKINLLSGELVENTATDVIGNHGRVLFKRIGMSDLDHKIIIEGKFGLYNCNIIPTDVAFGRAIRYDNIRINFTYETNGNEYIITMNIDSRILQNGATEVQFKYNTETKKAELIRPTDDFPFCSIEINGVRWESDVLTYTASIKRTPEYKESCKPKKLARKEEKEEREEREDSLILDKTDGIPKRRKAKRTLAEGPFAVMDTSIDFSRELAIDPRSTCIVYERNAGTLRKYGGVFNKYALTGQRMQCGEILIIGSRYDEKLKGDRIVRYRAVWEFPMLWNKLQMYDIYFDDEYMGKGITATCNQESENYYSIRISVVKDDIIHQIYCEIKFENSIVVTATELHETTKIDLSEEDLKGIDIDNYITHNDMKLIGVKQTFRKIGEEDLQEQVTIYQNLPLEDRLFMKKRESEMNLDYYIEEWKTVQAKIQPVQEKFQNQESYMETIPDTMMEIDEYKYDDMTGEQKMIYNRMSKQEREYFENLYNAPIIKLIIEGFVN